MLRVSPSFGGRQQNPTSSMRMLTPVVRLQCRYDDVVLIGGVVIHMTLINQSVGVGMEYTVATQEGAGEAVVHLVVDGSVGLGLDLAPATAEKMGLVVVGVAEAGLAATAGVAKGDVVVAVNASRVAAVAAAEAVRMVADAAATGAVTLTLWRKTVVFGFPA